MSTQPSGRSIAVALSVVVAMVVLIGLYLVGSPGAARQEALDQRRVNDLREAKRQVNAYWRAHGALPATLDSTGSSTSHRDPVTGTPYEYRATGDGTFELCAVFTDASQDQYPDEHAWRHREGRHCYPFSVKGLDPDPLRN